MRYPERTGLVPSLPTTPCAGGLTANLSGEIPRLLGPSIEPSASESDDVIPCPWGECDGDRVISPGFRGTGIGAVEEAATMPSVTVLVSCRSSLASLTALTHS